jgi:hypothetical protein
MRRIGAALATSSIVAGVLLTYMAASFGAAQALGYLSGIGTLELLLAIWAATIIAGVGLLHQVPRLTEE